MATIKLLILAFAAVALLLLPEVRASEQPQGPQQLIFSGEVVGPNMVSIFCPEGLTYETVPARPETPENETVWLLIQPAIDEFSGDQLSCMVENCLPFFDESVEVTVASAAACLRPGFSCFYEEGNREYQIYSLASQPGADLVLVPGLTNLTYLSGGEGGEGQSRPPIGSDDASILSVTAFMAAFGDSQTEVRLDIAQKQIDILDYRNARIEILQGTQVEQLVGDELKLEFSVEIPASCLEQPSPTSAPTSAPTLFPTVTPSLSPTFAPSLLPTFFPTLSPSLTPTTFGPVPVPTTFTPPEETQSPSFPAQPRIQPRRLEEDGPDSIAELSLDQDNGYPIPGDVVYLWTLACEPPPTEAPTQVPTVVPTTAMPTLTPTWVPTSFGGGQGTPTTFFGGGENTKAPTFSDGVEPDGQGGGNGDNGGGDDDFFTNRILKAIPGALFKSPVLQVPRSSFLSLFANSTDPNEERECVVLAVFIAAKTALGNTPIFGTSETYIRFKKSKPVALIKGGDVFPVLEKGRVSFDGSASCDPNAQITCDADQGNLGAPATWLPAPLTYAWSCVQADGNSCPDDLVYNNPTFEIPEDVLIPELSPYQVFLNVSTELAGPPIASLTKVVTINVLANPSGIVCPRPPIFIASLPPRVNAKLDGGVSIAGKVDFVDLASTDAADFTFAWTVVTLEDDGATTLSPLTSLPGFSALSNLNGFGARPNLYLPASLLAFGSTYRFRLTALTACNRDFPELDPYAEISFAVNSPPTVNQILVTPSTGFAVATMFKLEALSFGDLDGDLPLQFAFEYAYVGDQLEPQDRVTASLSNYSPNSFLNTVLQVPPRQSGGRMKIFVVARDTLGAESTRVSQEIVVDRPFPDDIQSLDEALNVREVLDNAVLVGGNSESVLRTIQAIASICNEAGAAAPTSILSQWNRAARETMMSESLKLRAVLRESNLLTPRVLAMEASALKNVLAVPFEVSLNSQQTGVVLINEILESAKEQLNELSKGESADELLPPDLVQSSLQSISLLAEAALAVLAQASAEDGDIMEQPGYNVTEESCEDQNSIFFPETNDTPPRCSEPCPDDKIPVCSELGCSCVPRTLRQQSANSDWEENEINYIYGRSLEAAPTSMPTKAPKIAPEPRNRTIRQSEACEVLTNMRSAIGGLASVKLFGAQSGRVQDVLSVGSVRIVVAREDTAGIGQGEGVQQLNLGLGGGSNETESTAFRLPPNILSSGTLNGRVPPSQVDIVAVQWSFDVRCDNDTNVFENAFETELPNSQEECALLDIEVNSPISGISGVSTLEFFDSTNATDRLSPSGLEDKIQIQVPVSEEVLLEDAQYCGGGNSTTIKCGYFDEEFGGGWTTDGCNVTEINYEEFYVVCECNHASDYSAWQAFVEDVDSTFTAPFTNPIEVVTTLAIVFLVAVIPSLVFVYVAMMFWAQWKDSKQVDKVPRGALVLMVLNHTMMQSKQRRFFALMKAKMEVEKNERIAEGGGAQEASEVKATCGGIHPSDNDDEGNERNGSISSDGGNEDVVTVTVETDKNNGSIASDGGNEDVVTIAVETDEDADEIEKPSTGVGCFTHLKRWWTALRHEHSIMGLWRFDPHYTRVQRVSVFIGVLVGNLFGSALFFFLKNGEDISTEFLVVVVIATSLLVAVPIRFMVKVVFRSSANRVGSRMDIAAQIYRMGQGRTDTGTTTVEDATLVLAYKQLFIAERVSNETKQAFKEAREDKKQLLRRTSSNASNVVGLLMQTVLPVPTPDEEVKYDSGASTPPELREKTGIEELENPEKAYESAKLELIVAKEEVKRATQLSKEAWSRSGPIYGKRAAVKAQRSRLMKMAALVGESDAKLPRSRKALLRPCWSRFAWLVLAIMYVLSTYYICVFIVTRNDSLTIRNEDATPAEVVVLEEEVMTAWLVTSFTGVFVGYFVIEPLVQLLRFTVFPWILSTCGVAHFDEDGVSGFGRAQTLQNSRRNSRRKNVQGTAERAADFGLEFTAELVENLF